MSHKKDSRLLWANMGSLKISISIVSSSEDMHGSPRAQAEAKFGRNSHPDVAHFSLFSNSSKEKLILTYRTINI